MTRSLRNLDPVRRACAARVFAAWLATAAGCASAEEVGRRARAELRRVRVEAVVVDAAGRPIEGAAVRVRRADGAALADTARTEAAGTARWSVLARPEDGRCTVEAAARGTYAASVVVDLDGEFARVTLALRPSTPVRGMVTDPQGRPLADVEVRAADGLAPRRVADGWDVAQGAVDVTGADGRFVIYGAPPCPLTTLEARRDGYAPTSFPPANWPRDHDLLIEMAPLRVALFRSVVGPRRIPILPTASASRVTVDGSAVARPTWTPDDAWDRLRRGDATIAAAVLDPRAFPTPESGAAVETAFYDPTARVGGRLIFRVWSEALLAPVQELEAGSAGRIVCRARAMQAPDGPLRGRPRLDLFRIGGVGFDGAGARSAAAPTADASRLRLEAARAAARGEAPPDVSFEVAFDAAGETPAFLLDEGVWSPGSPWSPAPFEVRADRDDPDGVFWFDLRPEAP